MSNKDIQIGDVFTPVSWGEFAVEKFDLFNKWIQGARLFDPTMGEGNLLESLITYGLAKGYSLNELPTQNLFGNELNTVYFQTAKKKFLHQYGLDFSTQLTNEDFLKLPPKAYDIVFGNPPWQNFVDLPETYKEQIKNEFHRYDLIGNRQSLLLGGSRIDLSALIIQKAIQELQPNGEAVVFMPLSLLLNEGAHKHFRTYSIGEVHYALKTVYDFNKDDVFGGIATRYGLSHFIRNEKTTYPIPYFRKENKEWKEYLAQPLFSTTDPLSITEKKLLPDFGKISPIPIHKESTPRQGINTCGANDIFFFNEMKEEDKLLVKLSNKTSQNILLPKEFVFPLISSQEFTTENNSPSKWVFLPYNTKGKPIDEKQHELYPEMKNYLIEHKERLSQRKGVMLNALVKRGFWWALLGVGSYNFFPYKVVWEAYGKSRFLPKIFEGNWQANQSLQAYIPVKSLAEAERLLEELSNPKIENYLLSLKMEGTMNWAQPGKIKKLLQYQEQMEGLF